ncbi:MAG: hypothetical protein GX322_04575 [Firmicutes bacterium]|nr:hypothetical protein [Bacillota bacterium]
MGTGGILYWSRVVVLAIVLLILFGVSGVMFPIGAGVEAESTASGSLFTFIACLLHAGILSHLIVRSSWHGWRLIAAIFVIYYGIMTFLSQIETVVFLEHLTDIVRAEDLPALFAQGAIVAGVFSLVAVLAHGKFKKQTTPSRPVSTLQLTYGEWIKRLGLIAVIYVVLYLGFGALVFRPLVGAAFSEYYGDLELPAWILLLQAARALVWVALALPIMRMFQGRAWEVNLAIALSYSILMGALLLIPTDIMPTAIRWGHFVEVSLSNFIFGWLVGAILQQPGKNAEIVR